MISKHIVLVTDEHVHDANAGRRILESVKDRIMKIFGDMGYDSKARFNEFRSNTTIPLGRNASSQIKGSSARAKVVKQIRRAGERVKGIRVVRER